MKTIFAIVLLFVGIHSSQAQENQTLSSFDKILIKGNLQVDLIAGDAVGIEIERGEEDRIEYYIKGDQLVVRHKEMFKYKSYRDFPIQITITYAELRNLDARAGAQVLATNSITGIRLDMHLGSGAQFKGDVQVEKIDVDIAEGAIAELSGRVSRFTANSKTGGRLEAFEMSAEDTKVRSTTGGVIEVSAYKSLDAKANTGGNIIYQGKPDLFVINDDLGGCVRRKK